MIVPVPPSVFLSAGHGGADPGACAHGRREADIAVDFRNIVAHCLRDLGVSYARDGEGNENLPLREALKLVKQHTVSVEFHCNAATPAATGVETLSGPKHMPLGASICNALANELRIRNRGAKPENAGQHHRLAFVQAGGIIVELFFITNCDDLAAYDARKWPAARAVAQVLADALGS